MPLPAMSGRCGAVSASASEWFIGSLIIPGALLKGPLPFHQQAERTAEFLDGKQAIG